MAPEPFKKKKLLLCATLRKPSEADIWVEHSIQTY